MKHVLLLIIAPITLGFGVSVASAACGGCVGDEHSQRCGCIGEKSCACDSICNCTAPEKEQKKEISTPSIDAPNSSEESKPFNETGEGGSPIIGGGQME